MYFLTLISSQRIRESSHLFDAFVELGAVKKMIEYRLIDQSIEESVGTGVRICDSLGTIHFL